MKFMSSWIVGILIAAAAGVSSAHSLNLFVHEEGGVVKGSAYFTGGAPAKNLGVQILDETGAEVAQLQTDAQGNFVHSGPWTSGAVLRFVVTTADGHRAESVLDLAAASAQPDSAVDAAPAAGAESASRQLGALHEALDRLEKRLWLRDVIGGIGYIFGLAGLWALWKSRSGGARH